MSEEMIIHTTCVGNCGGRCLLHAHVRDGEILRLSTDTAEAAGEGPILRACPKGLSCHKTFLGPDRLLYPMKRVGKRGQGKFQRISWDEALDIIASEWVRIRDSYGPGSRYVNYATGVEGVLNPSTMAKRLLNLDGGYLGGYNSYSSACMTQATKLMYGTSTTGSSLESWQDSELIILWGHNPSDTRFDCSMQYLQKARAKGVPIIVVDPRYSDTARQLGAEWIALRPATDAALLDAMAYTIYTEGLHDQAFLDRCCIGFDKAHMPDGADPADSVLSYLLGETDGIPKSPEWAESITAVPAGTIRSLALRYARAKPAALIQGLGAQRHAYGEQSARGGILLACMTGNVGVWGGWACGNGNFDLHAMPSFHKGEKAFPMSIPTYLWTEAVERGHEMTALDGVTGGERLPSDIKMIINLAGNCLVNQHGDINRTKEILSDETKCEFILCSDLFMTSSARFADILLPGVSMFETVNITTPWAYGSFLGFANKLIEPLSQCRFEYDWLAELADRLGYGEAFSHGRTAEDWLRHIYGKLRRREKELPPYEDFKAAGVYRYKNNPPFVAFEREVRDIENHPFPTESGKIELYSEKARRAPCRDFFPAIPRYVPAPEGYDDPLAERYPLQLIGWHSIRRTHSVHDNNPDLEPIEPQRLWMHPSDAAKRSISDGDEVYVWNDRGRIRVPVKITERILPGVTALAQGAWYAPDADGTDTRGNINTLTSLRPTPYARGNAQHTNLVQVEKA